LALEIANYYRTQLGSGDMFFVDKNIAETLKKFCISVDTIKIPIGFKQLYYNINKLDYSNEFLISSEIKERLIDLSNNFKITILSDATNFIVDNIFRKNAIGIDIFDKVISWSDASYGPPKKVGKEKIFNDILLHLKYSSENTIVIGDSLETDIYPAIKAGIANVCHISKKNIDDNFNRTDSILNISFN
jgi:FMN phosphatase YigB (HAD superfamily)